MMVEMERPPLRGRGAEAYQAFSREVNCVAQLGQQGENPTPLPQLQMQHYLPRPVAPMNGGQRLGGALARSAASGFDSTTERIG